MVQMRMQPAWAQNHPDGEEVGPVSVYPPVLLLRAKLPLPISAEPGTCPLDSLTPCFSVLVIREGSILLHAHPSLILLRERFPSGPGPLHPEGMAVRLRGRACACSARRSQAGSLAPGAASAHRSSCFASIPAFDGSVPVPCAPQRALGCVSLPLSAHPGPSVYPKAPRCVPDPHAVRSLLECTLLDLGKWTSLEMVLVQNQTVPRRRESQSPSERERRPSLGSCRSLAVGLGQAFFLFIKRSSWT